MLAASCGSDSDTSPPAIPSDSDAIAVAAGNNHTCALQQTGQIACWGSNEDGQLGDGTNDNSAVPVPVTGIDDAKAIATSNEIISGGHSCALHRDGTISCWGHNRVGQLGNGSNNSSTVPVTVKNIVDATAIATGESHTCALHEGGTISCWGSNIWGELGNGQINQNSENNWADSPVQVVSITDATAIAAGFDHSCALLRDGTVSCWGRNDWGQLEADTADTLDISSVPVPVEGINDATAIAVGGAFSCALHDSGTLSCWGRNDFNQLGSDTTDIFSAPVPVADTTDATAMTAGGQHSCVLHEDGTISCWGTNISGRLGNGNQVDSTVPVQVTGIDNATAITAGFSHSCALHQNGTISCWGNNDWGQLGNGTNNNYAVPVAVIDFPPARAEETTTTALARTPTTAISETAAAPTTALTVTTEAAPTASPPTTTTTATTSAPTTTTTTTTAPPPPTTAPPTAAAQTAPPTSNAPPPTQPPTTAPPPPTTLPANRAKAITAGGTHSCALHQTGTIFCWGSNRHGQLGNGQSGRNASSAVPVQVLSITDATAVAAGEGHSCALHQNGTISCWGRNNWGQLGNGNEAFSVLPVQIQGITDATSITTSKHHSCALHQNGTISCWGNNDWGQQGNGQSGNNARSSVPVQVADISDATAITTSEYHSCALHQDSTISCWGRNNWGQLGNGQGGNNAISSVPVQVFGIIDATAITADVGHSCALHQDGTISCWGSNNWGQLGNGQGGDNPNSGNADSSVPVQVTGITDATAITAGNGHSCALHQEGTISCWGSNQHGQLGNGQSGRDNLSWLPVRVEDIIDATAITAVTSHFYTSANSPPESRTCALHQDGTISCWGSNSWGQLGNGTTQSSSVPVKVTGFGG